MTIGLWGNEFPRPEPRSRADLLVTLSTWRFVIEEGGEGGNVGVGFRCVDEWRRLREPGGDSDSSSSLISIPGHA